MSETKASKLEKAQAIETLRALLAPGDTVYTVVRHVAQSGMTRWIDCYVIRDGAPDYISRAVAKAIGYPVNVGNRDGIKVGGCGMDMGFHVVYSLSRVLFSDGYGCTGDRCGSNDHSNGDRDYTPGHHHSDGGYALQQRWL